MPDLDWHRQMGAVTRTRYSDLHVWHQAKGLWRHIVGPASDCGVTGPPFKTKMEALAAVEDAAERWDLPL